MSRIVADSPIWSNQVIVMPGRGVNLREDIKTYQPENEGNISVVGRGEDKKIGTEKVTN